MIDVESKVSPLHTDDLLGLYAPCVSPYGDSCSWCSPILPVLYHNAGPMVQSLAEHLLIILGLSIAQNTDIMRPVQPFPFCKDEEEARMEPITELGESLTGGRFSVVWRVRVVSVGAWRAE